MIEEEELFDDAAPEEVTEAPEPQAEPEAPEPEKPEIPEGTVTVEAPQQQDERPMVPLAALHEVRDELKQLKAEAERNKQQPEPPQEIDPWDDLPGALNHQAQTFQQQLYAQQLAMSERFARQQHGDDLVTQAVEWGRQRCESDPHFNAQVMQSGDPVGFAIEQFQRDQIASKVDLSEYEQFQAWKQAQAAAQGNTTQPTSQKPPRSIASAPSAGGSQTIAMGPEAVFDEEFK